MIDFYFLTFITSIIWQIFTLLFFLYRFTSFFKLIYNFIKFLGGGLQRIYYIKDYYFIRKNAYSRLNENDNITTNGTGTEDAENYFTIIYNWILGRKKQKTTTLLPLYETRTSFIYNDMSQSEIQNMSSLNDSIILDINLT